MSLRAKLLWVALLMVFAGGLFYLRSLAKRIFFELPLHSDESAKARLSEAVLQSGAGPNEIAVLYFPSLNDRKLVARVGRSNGRHQRMIEFGRFCWRWRRDHVRAWVTPWLPPPTFAPFS